MPDLSIQTTQTGGGDFRWLRSHHSRDDALPVTIQRDLLQAGTHYDKNGVVPAGLPLGKLTGRNAWGPYDPTVQDGRQYLAGFLLGPIQLSYDFSGVTSVAVHGALVCHGVIDPAYVPTAPALNTAVKTTGQFVFAGTDYVEEA
jgi:hypothetical protein